MKKVMKSVSELNMMLHLSDLNEWSGDSVLEENSLIDSILPLS